MKPILFDFSSPAKAEAAASKFVTLFARAGAEVASSEVDAREYKTAGVSFRKVALSFTDSQTVTLMVKATGDVYQVLVNGRSMPIRKQDDPAKSIAEVAAVLTAGRASFQKRLSRVRTKAETEGGRGLATRLMRKRQLGTIVAEKQAAVESKTSQLEQIRGQIAALSA